MKLFCYDYVDIEDKIYFSAVNFNGLFEYSKVEHRTRLLTCFNEEVERSFLHSKIFKYKSSVWLVPNNAERIYEYNLEKELLNSYCIPETKMVTKKSFFLGGEIVGEKLYLFPCRYNGIIVFNLEKRNIEKVIAVDAEWTKTGDLYSFKGASIYADKIFFANINEDVYEIIDLITNTRKKVYLEDEYNGITHMHVDENNTIIVGKNGKVGVYDINGEKKYSTQFKERTDGPKFFDICNMDGILYLTETDVNKIGIYNSFLNEKEEYFYPVCEKKQLNDFWAYALFIKCQAGRIFFQSVFDGYIYCVENGKVRKLFDLSWDMMDSDYEKMKSRILKINREQYDYDLKLLLKCL